MRASEEPTDPAPSPAPTRAPAAAPGPPADRAPTALRLAALALDLLVIVAYGAGLAVVATVVLSAVGGAPEVLRNGGLPTQLLGLVTLVVPVGLYLFLSERSAAQATWGKRRVGLRVVRVDGGRPSTRAVATRTVVKLLPWEVAHTFVHQVVQYEVALRQPSPSWVLAGLLVADVLPLVWLGLVLLTPSRRGPHERVSGTRVVLVRASLPTRAAPPPPGRRRRAAPGVGAAPPPG